MGLLDDRMSAWQVEAGGNCQERQQHQTVPRAVGSAAKNAGTTRRRRCGRGSASKWFLFRKGGVVGWFAAACVLLPRVLGASTLAGKGLRGFNQRGYCGAR